MSHLKRLQAATSLSDVASILGFKPKSLAYILYKKPKSLKYREFDIPKRSGGKRTISAPYEDLMNLQRRLAELLQNCIDDINRARKIESTLSHGFRRKHSIITNAAIHRNKRYVFNVDLENYFGTINFGRVRGFFIKNRNFELNLSVATILAQIACHDNVLPQGSPCSPVISNLIGHVLDIRLASLAHKLGCDYSRYADDLTFSTNKPVFPSTIAYIVDEEKHQWRAGKGLERIVKKAGFMINASKTRMQYDNSRQEVTGLVVNKKINTRAEYRRTARAMAHRLFTTGTFQIKKTNFDDKGNLVITEVDGTLARLSGILSFIDSIDVYNRKKDLKPSEKRKDLKPLDNPNSNEKVYKHFLFFKNFYAISVPLIICEGKTDNIYIRAAIRQLAEHYPQLATRESGKISLKIRLFRYSRTTARLFSLSGGTPNLLKLLREYANHCGMFQAAGLQHPVIMLIDNDHEAKKIYSFVKSAMKDKRDIDGSKPFYFVTHNLYVVPTPKERGGKDTIIEDFFDQSVKDIKIRGKTFNPSNGSHDTASEYGKVVFAEQVVRKNQDKIDFNGFKPILDNIVKVLKDYKKKST
jgi:RNA-directed DNA polymerase